jgi:CRP-like cAMP-binding protein
MRRLSLAPGDYVYRVDEPSECIYLVRSGQVQLITTYPETGDAVDALFGPGRVFGEVELIDSRSRVSHARVPKQVPERIRKARRKHRERTHKAPAHQTAR